MSNPSKQQTNDPRQQRRDALPQASLPRRSHALQLALLCTIVAAATLFAHWPSLSAQAKSFDDEEAIIVNRLIQNPSWNSVGRFFGEITLSSVVRGYYRPLTLTSFMLDWAMGGRPDDFRVFHRTSLALHVGSTVLLILLCYQVFRQPLIAALVGLLFGVHPLTVEPIAWVMERKTLLATFFAFACLIAYVRYTQQAGKRWFIVSTVLFLLSLLAKPTGTPLPIIMLLMDIWPLKRFSGSSDTRGSSNTCGTGILPVRLTGWKPVPQVVLEKIPFLALSIIFAVLCMICEQKVNPLSLPAKLSPLHLPLRLCWLTVFYPCKILLPMDLSSVYMLPDPLSLANGWVLLAAIGAVLMAAALALSSRWTPAFWTTAAMFYVGLAPTMGFVGYSWVAASDKYAYLPAVGPVLLLCRLLQRIWQPASGTSAYPRRAAIIAAVLLCAGLLTLGTRKYLWHWQTTDRLTALHVRLAPNSAGAQYQRGKALHDKGDLQGAILSYSRNIELRPDFAHAYNNRGSVYYASGDYDRTIQDCTKAIELDPLLAGAYYNRGIAYAKKGDYRQTIRDQSKAIELDPDFVEAYIHRAAAYYGMLNLNQAISDLSKAIEIKPDHAKAFGNRAIAYFYAKQYDKAWSDVNKCRQLGGTPYPDLIKNLSEATDRTE